MVGLVIFFIDCGLFPCHPFHHHPHHQDLWEHFLHFPPPLPQPEQLYTGHHTGVIWPYQQGCLNLQQIQQFEPIFHYMQPCV